jgi:restriction system protein
MSKSRKLIDLARKRQSDRVGRHGNIADYHNAAYEIDSVSPYSRLANNVDADVMVIGQDWASDGYLRGEFRQFLVDLGYDPSLATNKNLQQLLKRHFGIEFSQTFATNLFPFAKAGNMSASIPARDLRYAATTYLLPQVEIIRPRIAICLGTLTYNVTRSAIGLAPVRGVDSIVASEFKVGATTVVGVAHTGQLGTNNRGRAQVDLDWRAIVRRFAS